MKEDINMLISNLSWDKPIDIQQDAIDKLIKIDDKDVILLVQPINKKYWENCSKILKIIGYPRNHLAIPGLLKWLQDMNWPGAWIAMETLQNIDNEIIMPDLEVAIHLALKENDELWIMALSELIFNRLHMNSKNFTNQELYNKLICKYML